MPIVDLISRHALEFLIGIVTLALLCAAAVLFLAQLAWKGREQIWACVAGTVGWIKHVPPVRWFAGKFPRIAGALSLQRLTATGFLELYLAAGLLLSAGTLLFLSLGEDILEKSGLVAFDLQLATALQNTITQKQLAFLIPITRLGNGATLTVLGLVVGTLLLVRKQRTLAIGWLLTLFGAGVLNVVLKASFHRVRPEYATIGGWSFPSGHAMGSFVAYGMLAYLGAIFLPRRPAQIMAGVLFLLVLLIGFSRLYLGVHYFSDVVAGYSAAVVWLAVCVSGTEVARLRGLRVKAFAPSSAGGAGV
ncbi:MAG: phosphatase PAP2 family protein [Gemmatimonadota bacterium]